MIYQETLRMLKKAASDPYTMDAPTGHSPMDYMTRYWLNNDPKIVDQRNRLNALKASDNQASNMGAKAKRNIDDLVEGSVKRVYTNNGSKISPRQAYDIANNNRNMYSNGFDRKARAGYHITRAAGDPYPADIRKLLLMRQNPRHGLNYFNTVDNSSFGDTDGEWLSKMTD